MKKKRRAKKRSRFLNWKLPEIVDGKPTKYGWIVKHKKNFQAGRGADIGAFTYINAKNGVTIGKDAQIGSHCSIYSVSTIDRKAGRVILEKNCKIGSHSVIMPGVNVGKNAVVGAFSFVNKNIPADSTAYGIPVKITKSKK